MKWERQPSSIGKAWGIIKAAGEVTDSCAVKDSFSCEKCKRKCYIGEIPNPLEMSASLDVTHELIL